MIKRGFVLVLGILLVSIGFICSLSISDVGLYNWDGTQTVTYGDKDLFVNFTTDGTEVANITDWRLNNVSLAVINMPFDVNQTSLSSSVADYSTYGNDGVSSGTVSADYSTNCVKGGCVDFTNKNGGAYISIENDSSFNFNGADFTVSFWVKFSSNSSSFMGLVSTRDAIYNCVPWGIWRYQGDLRIQRANSSCVSPGGGFISKAISGGLSQTDKWYHIAYVYSGGYGKIYLDDVEYVDNVYMVTDYVTNGIYIGRAASGFHLNGSIDELKIFNYSLSSQQVSNLYNSGLNNTDVLTLSKEDLSDGNYSVSLWSANSTENTTNILTNSISVDSLCVTLSEGENKIFSESYNISNSNCFGLSNNNVVDCQGNYFNGTSDNLIYGDGVENITIKNCKFFNYNSSLNLQNSENIVIKNSTFSNGTYQIYLNDVSNISIIDNIFLGSGFGVKESISFVGLNGSNISNNNFNLSDVSYSIISGNDINYTTISYNEFGSLEDEVNSTVGLGAGLINLIAPNYNIISYNNLYIGNNISGITTNRYSTNTNFLYGNLIENNYVKITTPYNVFGLVNTEGGFNYSYVNWTVRNNRIESLTGLSSGQHTMMIKYHNGSSIYNNTIIGGGYGVVFKDCINSKLYNNTFINQSFMGLHSKGSKDSDIYENIISVSSAVATYFWRDNSRNIASNNVSFYDNVFLDRKTIQVSDNVTNLSIINQSDFDSTFGTLEDSSVYVKWWFSPTVLDSSNNAVSGASINLMDSSNVSIHNFTTDSSGKVSRVALEEYFANETGYFYQENYSIFVSKDGYYDRTISFNLSLTENYDLDVNLVSLPSDEEPSSSSGGSSYLNAVVPDYYLERGYEAFIPKNYDVKFKVGEETYSVRVDNIVGDVVTVTVSGVPKTFDLSLNESRKVDLEGDDIYDVEVYLKLVRGNYANVVITKINEAYSEDVLDGKVVEEVEGEVVGEEAEKVGFFKKIWNWIKGLFGFE